MHKDQPTEKIQPRSRAPKLPPGATFTPTMKYAHHDKGKAMYEVTELANPIRRNRKQMRRDGLSTKEIKAIERKARELQRLGHAQGADMKLAAVYGQRSETGDAIEWVQCTECGSSQADMGRGVACESCGAGPMPTAADG